MANGAEIERAIRLFNNFKITNDPPLQVRIAMTRRQKEERQKIKQVNKIHCSVRFLVAYFCVNQSEILMVKNLLKREENQIYEARSLPGFEKFVEDISYGNKLFFYLLRKGSDSFFCLYSVFSKIKNLSRLPKR